MSELTYLYNRCLSLRAGLRVRNSETRNDRSANEAVVHVTAIEVHGTCLLISFALPFQFFPVASETVTR